MNDNVNKLLTELDKEIAPYVEIFDNLNKEHRKIADYEISVQLDRISSTLHNLEAQIKQLKYYLEHGILEKDRLQFLNTYID